MKIIVFVSFVTLVAVHDILFVRISHSFSVGMATVITWCTWVSFLITARYREGIWSKLHWIMHTWYTEAVQWHTPLWVHA